MFPVEEARVVQEFLDHVKEEEQDGGEAWDDLSSEELLERLEKLESLRELQSSNEDKVQTIDQSARSEDVQRALEKNPDISKERTNLLQVLIILFCQLLKRKSLYRGGVFLHFRNKTKQKQHHLEKGMSIGGADINWTPLLIFITQTFFKVYM